MTNEELTMRIKAGETDLMDDLWSQVNRFVCRQARKFINTYSDRCRQLGFELEDLKQEGYLAIHKAVEGFNAERSTTFLTYAGYHIKHRFFSVAKMNYRNWQNNAIQSATSIEEPISEEGLTIADTLKSNEDFEASVVDKVYFENAGRDLREAIAELREGWQEVLFAIYFQGIHQASLARSLGVARPVVTRKHRRGLETLRANKALQIYALA